MVKPHHGRKKSYLVITTKNGKGAVLLLLAAAACAIIQFNLTSDRMLASFAARNDGEEERAAILPSKPLCEECLKVVLKAKPVDLSFVNVRAHNQSHPHEGATFEQGNSSTVGYVYDVTRLRRNPPVFSLQGKELAEECQPTNDAEYVATQRLTLAADQGTKAGSSLSLLCAVYGMDNKRDQIDAIRETWGPKCDGFFIATARTDSSIDSVHIMQLNNDQYNNMWQKVRSMWSYIYDNYYDDFDWFHIGGDDMWLIVENLREYLGSEEIRSAANGGIYLTSPTSQPNVLTQTPLYLGCRWDAGDVVFNTGGPGLCVYHLQVIAGTARCFPCLYDVLLTVNIHFPTRVYHEQSCLKAFSGGRVSKVFSGRMEFWRRYAYCQDVFQSRSHAVLHSR
jgi:hypothetical protein